MATNNVALVNNAVYSIWSGQNPIFDGAGKPVGWIAAYSPVPTKIGGFYPQYSHLKGHAAIYTYRDGWFNKRVIQVDATGKVIADGPFIATAAPPPVATPITPSTTQPVPVPIQMPNRETGGDVPLYAAAGAGVLLLLYVLRK